MHTTKSLLLLSTLLITGCLTADYPAQEGYQVMPNQDALRAKKLDILEKQGQEFLAIQKSLTVNSAITLPRIFAVGSGTGAAVAVVGICKGNIPMIVGGLVGFGCGGIIAKYSSDAEKAKVHDVGEQIKQNTKAIENL